MNPLLRLVCLGFVFVVFTTASRIAAAEDYQVQFRVISIPSAELSYLLPPSTQPLDGPSLVEKVDRMLSSRQAEILATTKTRTALNSRATIDEDSRIEFEMGGSVADGIFMDLAMNPLRSSPEMRLRTQVSIVLGKPQLLGISQSPDAKQKDRVILMLVEVK